MVPLERKLEQKLWESFRNPIDEAFNRKTVEREQVASQMSAHDRAVLDASRALEEANASGDTQKIRAAMQALEAALRGQAVAVAAEQAATAVPTTTTAAQTSAPQTSAPEVAALPESEPVVSTPSEAVADPQESAAAAEGSVDSAEAAQAPQEPQAPVTPVAPLKPARPVVAVRGDDRPGQKKTELAPAGRGGKFGDRREGARDGRPSDKGTRPGDRFGDRADRGDRFERVDRGPRLGDAAFRAQRDALEHAEMTLRKLASQAHGETLGNLMSAWETRQADVLPSVQEFGKAVNAAARTAWAQAVSQAPQGAAQGALLRLEMAAEVPTPAEYLNERRGLQLQLLTKRNDPGPLDTWRLDVTAVLAAPHDASSARRLQNVLKQLLKR